MASSLAVAVSSVPADRWPDSLLWLTSHPFLPPCHSATFLIAPLCSVHPRTTHQGSFIVGLIEQESKHHFYGQTSCCQGFLCGNILRDIDTFSDMVFNFYLFFVLFGSLISYK